MEILKKILVIVALTVFITVSFAQSGLNRQSAFYKSYESEKSNNYNTAIKELIAVYKADDYFLNIRLGWLYYLDKNYSESIRFYERAITLKPNSVEARFGCIKPLSATENWDKVKNQYIQVLKTDPQNTVANYWLGVIYYNHKDYANAVKLFEKVVNLYPLDYDSVIMLAWTKLNLGSNVEAKYYFNHALTLRPNDSSSIEGLRKLK